MRLVGKLCTERIVWNYYASHFPEEIGHNAETNFPIAPIEGTGNIVLRKVGKIAYMSIGINGITLPSIWENKKIADIPDECASFTTMYCHYQTNNGVQCSITVSTNKTINIQPISTVNDNDSGYIRASFAYPTA